ncbi:hypothetical protein CYMTET_49054 [Cymbomonas tetramitiformis]|uniref:Uncharacterized protein n=1 Tax=Cymbomonas tetramitiformis TaxID=36881 RepID=A0AAE0EW60_9CHLO|nr:hypothetical protein CYMTET_49054 [Cymbomonas tetramitiformis]
MSVGDTTRHMLSLLRTARDCGVEEGRWCKGGPGDLASTGGRCGLKEWWWGKEMHEMFGVAFGTGTELLEDGRRGGQHHWVREVLGQPARGKGWLAEVGKLLKGVVKGDAFSAKWDEVVLEVVGHANAHWEDGVRVGHHGNLHFRGGAAIVDRDRDYSCAHRQMESTRPGGWFVLTYTGGIGNIHRKYDLGEGESAEGETGGKGRVRANKPDRTPVPDTLGVDSTVLLGEGLRNSGFLGYGSEEAHAPIPGWVSVDYSQQHTQPSDKCIGGENERERAVGPECWPVEALSLQSAGRWKPCPCPLLQSAEALAPSECWPEEPGRVLAGGSPVPSECWSGSPVPSECWLVKPSPLQSAGPVEALSLQSAGRWRPWPFRVLAGGSLVPSECWGAPGTSEFWPVEALSLQSAGRWMPVLQSAGPWSAGQEALSLQSAGRCEAPSLQSAGRWKPCPFRVLAGGSPVPSECWGRECPAERVTHLYTGSTEYSAHHE